MLVRWSRTTLLQIKLSLLGWSDNFLIADYAGHAEIEEKIEFIYKACNIAFKFGILAISKE